ncbi:MAG: hypothetical protein OEY87_09210 [Gammaproteobacteria bacterium]|nr:hypothetical protein [Gammaproteobacteria bacterium]MDH5736286.1 hypothetical protein [Gammaproteobacteria bacterium]
MISSVRLLAVFALLNVAIVNQAVANSVFADKNKSAHELSGAEQQTIRAEFEAKFAQKDAVIKVNSKDPWKAKEQREKSGGDERSATWGDCRESALKNRFGCYRDKKSPYQCERQYEARIKLCDDNL